MRSKEPLHARFLGWREWGAVNDLTGVASDAEDGAACTDGQKIAKARKHAIWSDDSLLECTDGFDFGSWRDELSLGPPALDKLNKVSVVRPRVVKVLPQQCVSKPETFTMATCPAALLEALEALQNGKGFLPEAALPPANEPPKGRRIERSPWIARLRGPETRSPRAQLLRLTDEAPTPTSHASLPPASEVEEEEVEALRTLADLADSELGKICRGSVPVVQRELERQNIVRAQMRRRVIEALCVAAWRRDRKRVVQLLLFANVEMLSGGSTTYGCGELSWHVQGSEYDGLMSGSDSEEDGSVKLEQKKLSERSRQLRKRVKDAAINGIREKKKFVDRMNRKRRFREAVWKALPQAERAATESAFKLHCNQFYTLTAEAALDALRDMGLRGRTMVERSVVERAVASLIKELISVEEQGIQGAWGAAPKGAPQVWWRTPRELSALPVAHMAQAKTKAPTQMQQARGGRLHNRRASSTQPRQASVSVQRSSTMKDEQAAKELVAAMEQKTPRPTGIPIEAFGAEVVPAARWELFEQRTEPHFRLFVKEIEASPNPSGLSYDQFQKLVASLELDKAKGPLPPAIKREKQKIGPETILDLEMVHIRLLQLEERAARAASTREWAVARQAKLLDGRFKKHRPELLWLWEMFTAHDEDHSGFLGQYEIRRLLKYMGLEPYKRSVADTVDHIIGQVDENHDDEIDFNEFLLLVDHLRSFMMKRRRSRLQRVFLNLELDQNNCLDFDQIVAALAQEGLLRSRSEYALAQELLDEEFDLRAVLQPSSEADSPAAMSPRSSSLSPRKMRQRQAMMADDAGSVDFYGFCLIYQLVWERLSQLLGERICQAAKALNFTMTELSDIQGAFDMADRDGDNKLTRAELREVLIPLIVRMPDEQQLKHVLASIDSERTEGIDIFEFLQILRSLVTGPNGMVHMYKPFSLMENVTFDKQQELLGVWPISDSYIKNLDANELMEMLSNFLGVRPEQNLRELPYPISSFRKLKEFATRQAEKATQRHRF
ncbi:RH35 [Symbiodinium pilosum]|uniref:RH35 protein n=1 Tax=Symbiodinium pilosum TaxID=2952 RepID=A0A812TX22_SYMPI|nr:RH35 [Symbiodinium pilosum]